jgi:hypothetical protein
MGPALSSGTPVIRAMGHLLLIGRVHAGKGDTAKVTRRA